MITWRRWAAAFVAIAPLLLFGSSRAVVSSSSEKGSTSADPELAGLSGRELAQRLIDERTRLGAFRELSRRKGRDLLEHLRHPELVVCPQGPGEAPLYLVLADFLPPNQATGPFGEGDFDALFPEEKPEPRDPLALRNELLIEVVTPDGEMLDAFGGDNVLNDGVIADVNGDGRIERVDHSVYGVDGIETVEVLRVRPVAHHATPTLNVLYNWGADEWGYELSDRDHDGRIEIGFGPRQAKGIRPKVAFAWDPARRSYVSPSGTRGAHFRVLEAGDDVWKQTTRLKAQGLQFPADPEALHEEEREPPLSFGRPERRIQAHSDPYVYRSLRGLGDDAVLRYMGDGPRAGELPPERTLFPDDFWTTSPGSAAAKYLEGNRSPGHKATFRIAFDDRDGAAAPESGSVAYYASSAPCYEATTSVWFLSALPGSSYLAHGSSSRAGTVYFDFVRTQPSFEVTYAPVPDSVAKQVLRAIWWLSRVRSKSRNDSGTSFGGVMGSTADGRGRLTVRTASGDMIADAQGRTWAGLCGDRWTGEYDEDVFLNLAAQLIETALPAQLGRDWPRTPDCRTGACRRSASTRGHDLVRRDSERILRRFEPGGNGVPAALAALAVGAQAELGVKSARDAFEELLRSLPERDPALPDAKAVEARLRSMVPFGKSHNSDVKGSLEDWQDAMRDDDRLRLGSDDAAGRELLRKALQLGIRQLRAWDDVAALERWAVTDEAGWRFAMSRLRELDKNAYVRALEVWLAKSKDEDRRQVFSALEDVAPERARQLAEKAGADGDLAVASFDVLSRANTIPDEGRRVAALVAIVNDSTADWKERVRAIGALAPEEDPLRFKQNAIDDALLARLRPADGGQESLVVGPAATALARRGRIGAFERLLEAWSACEIGGGSPFGAGDVMGALVRLLPQASESQRQRLTDAFRARLRQTNGFVSEVVLTIWASDLRDLLPDLERVATSSPEDVEGEAASSWRGGSPRPIADRFHTARKVAALWNEEDPYTRARLLLAFARFEAVLSSPERKARIKESLASMVTGLSRADYQRLQAFLQVVEAGAQQDLAWTEHTRELSRLAREAFRWPSR
jgi:hypothetical protein